jgi:hypothetical protein
VLISKDYSDTLDTWLDAILSSAKVTIIPLGEYHRIYLSRNRAKVVLRNIVQLLQILKV